MPDFPDEGSSRGGEAPDEAPSSSEQHTEQWSTLEDLLNASGPKEVVERVRTLTEEADSPSSFESPREASAQDEDAAAVLGLQSADEARELDQAVRRLSARLDELAQEKETLADALGLADADAILDLVRSMEDQLSALYDDAPPARPAETGGPASVEGVLGVSNVQEARELASYVHEMNDRLEQLAAEHEKLAAAGLDVDTALGVIESMEAQLIALYGAGAPEANGEGEVPSADSDDAAPDTLDPSIAEVLGISSQSEAEELDRLVRRMGEHLDDLRAETAKLAESGLTADDALDMIDSMEEQLVALYQARETEPEDRERAAPDEQARPPARTDRLAAIEDVLGVSTPEEAHELAALVRSLDAQLQSLYDEREKLHAVGLSDVEDAVSMIQSMEGQLQNLYQEQEALQDAPEEPAHQDTFQQLESLYKKQERVKRALGVSDLEDAVELVEDLQAQLDALYARQDEQTPPQRAFVSMQNQLETLYREKETLLRRGFESVEEAVEQIDHLQKQLYTLRRRHDDCRQRMRRLRAELGTAEVEQIVRAVEASRSEADASVPLPAPEGQSPEPTADPFVHDGPALIPDETLDRLDEMTVDALDALSVGVLRLGDAGDIQYLNEAGMALPGVREQDARDSVTGRNLFELVPAASSAPFLGRFENGVQRGEMDARFPYTFVLPGDSPTTFQIHLYRAGEHQANWLLVQPAS